MNKKRRKVSRHRGTHTHGRGAKKKARGKGHRGGTGKAGTGKRGDQKKTLILKRYGKKYFGKDKIHRGDRKKDIKIINLQKISYNINNFIKKGLAKGSKGNFELDLSAYKIIGDDDLKMKLKINALAASKGAQEAVKKAGGEIIIKLSKNKEKKNTKKDLEDSEKDEK